MMRNRSRNCIYLSICISAAWITVMMLYMGRLDDGGHSGGGGGGGAIRSSGSAASAVVKRYKFSGKLAAADESLLKKHEMADAMLRKDIRDSKGMAFEWNNEENENDKDKDNEKVQLKSAEIDRNDLAGQMHEEQFSLNEIPEVDLDKLAIINGPTEQEIYDEGFKKYVFNEFLSKRIGPRRRIPDTRHYLCQNESYAEDLPSASIIICYYNEAPSALIRMVNSILDRTPLDLLHEILLIDDCSDLDNTSDAIVREYAKENWSSDMVKMLRTQKNEGLIRAKMFGAKHASAEVIIFLDSHCEVNERWIEPLLDRIHTNPHIVVCPIIDIIDADTMKYVESPVCKGGMSWSLVFKWDYPQRSYFNETRQYIRPLQSATMAGGLFAISREYFYELGQYDRGMDIWGAENVEISLRIWMCGGRLEIIPCSRVGHIFRKRRPYGSGVDSMGRNALRAANVWLDNYIDKFYEEKPHLRNVDFGDISEMRSIRERLHCKPFRWFLENIYPELLPNNYPSPQLLHEQTPQYWLANAAKFHIRLKNTTLCLSAESNAGRVSRGARIQLERCHHSQRQQIWRWTKLGELRPMGSATLCFDSLKGPRLLKCHQQGAHQQWITMEDSKLYNAAIGQCIYADKELLAIAENRFCSVASQWEFIQINSS